MRRLLFLVLEGAARAAAGSAACCRIVFVAPDPPARRARLRGDDRRARTSRSSSPTPTASTASRELIAALRRVAATSRIADVRLERRRGEPVPRARRGVDGAVDPRRATAATMAPGGRRRVQVVADGTDANSTNIGAGLRDEPGGGLRAGTASRRGCRRRAPTARRHRAATCASGSTRSSRASDFMIPGVLALLLIVMTVVLASMGIVREKELGTLEQLNVTPLRRWELIVGKLLPYAPDRHDRRLPRRRRRGAAGSRCRCAAASALLFALSARLPAEHAGPRAVRVDRSPTTSSRR